MSSSSPSAENATAPSCTDALPNGILPEGFCAMELPISINKPRSIIKVVDNNNNNGSNERQPQAGFFVLERGTESIVYIYDSNNDDVLDTKKYVVSAVPGLNHGLALHTQDGCTYLYASSDTTVYRWQLDVSKTVLLQLPLLSDPEIVVVNINADGQGGAPQGHTTRTIVFDEASEQTTTENSPGNSTTSSMMMYISVGSNSNVDPDSYRSRIRRARINIAPASVLPSNSSSSSSSSSLPIDFQTMEVVADGLRNEVGLAFDKHGYLWGVENSADRLYRGDLGGDIHQDNPAEELNKFDITSNIPGHYGYPYCFTEYHLPTEQIPTDEVRAQAGKGTVWAWPSFLDNTMNGDTSITDESCRSNYIPPALAMQGHSAPLGITFYDYYQASRNSHPEDQDVQYPACTGIQPFPQEMDGYAFIAYHGSWNRDIPTGYKVVYVPMDADGNVEYTNQDPIDLLAHEGGSDNAQWEDGFRPVDVVFDDCGRLLVTSDGTQGRGSKIVRIEYIGSGDNNSSSSNADGPASASSSSTASALHYWRSSYQLEHAIVVSLLLWMTLRIMLH